MSTKRPSLWRSDERLHVAIPILDDASAVAGWLRDQVAMRVGWALADASVWPSIEADGEKLYGTSTWVKMLGGNQ